MTRRLKTMRRILAVQSQVKRLAEWQLSAIENRQREIEVLGRDLDGFIEQANLAGSLADLALRSRRRLAVGEAAADKERVLQAEATREARSRAKLAERMVEALAADERRVRERQDLDGILEGLANRGKRPDAG